MGFLRTYYAKKQREAPEIKEGKNLVLREE